MIRVRGPVQISTVIFDFDDVLCHYDRPEHIRQIGALVGLEAQTVFNRIWGSGLDNSADEGKIDADEYIAECGRRLAFPYSREQWMAGRHATTYPNNSVLNIAEQLGQWSRIVILTNNTTLVTDYIDAALPRVRLLFGQGVYTSSQLGATKPSPAIYLRLCSLLKVSPSRTLFIDDSPENVEGAAKVGMHSCVFTSASGLAKELTQYEFEESPST